MSNLKTPGTLLKDLIANVIANTNAISYFGKDGVVRAILNAIAIEISELWNDLYQTTRSIFVDTSSGTKLDELAARNGLTRLGATKSSVVLIFNGPATTVIPSETIVKSNITGQQYKTVGSITLGAINPNIQRPIWDNSIGDAVVAESLDTGSKTQVGVEELTQLQSPISGVTLSNIIPSIGGLDAETDEQLRYRIKNRISLLNQGTQQFYETLCKEVEPTVFNAFAMFNPLSLGTKIYLIKNSFAPYLQAELDAIATYVYDRQRALSPVLCVNAGIKSVEVRFEYTRDEDITQATIFSSIAQKIADLVESNYDFGAVIKYQDILNIVIDTDGVDELVINTLLVNNHQANVVCTSLEVPRFTYLKINDGTELPIIINQKYVTVE
jgi:uncharacterized phage protein gp47/JayE